MKIVTRKAEKRQQEQTRQQIVRAANYGYNAGYDTAMAVVYVTIGSALISAMIANTIVDQSYKRSIMKLAKTNFNIDKTIVHMSNKMVDITNCGNSEKGFKKFTKFLFDCDRSGFEFWNPDVSKMILIIGFDNFRNKINELEIIIGKLDGKGNDTIKGAFKDWKKYGSNIFPYGSASAWKDLLVKDYEFNGKLQQIRVILNGIKSGTVKDGDIDSLNTLLGLVESEYSGAASQMAAQSTHNCAAYRNAEHFKKLIEVFLKETIEALGVPFEENGKQLRIKRIDSSTIEVIQAARVEKMKRRPLVLPHRGSRTLEPPKQTTGDNGSSKKPSKKKKASQKDEDLDEDFDEDFDDDFFDDEDDEDFNEENDFKEVITPKKSKKPVKKAPTRKIPDPEPEPEYDESDDAELDTEDEPEDSDESDNEVEFEVDDAEKEGPIVKKAHQNIVNTVKQLHMKQSAAKRNRLKQQLHSQVTSFMSKYNVTKEDLCKITPGLKEVY